MKIKIYGNKSEVTRLQEHLHLSKQASLRQRDIVLFQSSLVIYLKKENNLCALW